MGTLDEAGRLSGCDSGEVYRWIEAGEVHFIETADGRLYVCLASLVQKRGGSKQEVSGSRR